MIKLNGALVISSLLLSSCHPSFQSSASNSARHITQSSTAQVPPKTPVPTPAPAATFNPSAVIQKSSDQTTGETELIWDPSFANGVSVIPACKNPDSNSACANGQQYVINNPYGNTANAPTWSLGQWGSRGTLPSQGVASQFGFTYEDFSKLLGFGPHGEIVLGVNGKAEFYGQYADGIGLILQQTISAPGAGSHESGSLDQMASLRFSVDMKLLEENRNISAGYDAAKNADIFPINFTVQNLNRESPGYGQYIWFQIMTYGDRGLAGFYVNGDVASGMLIYAIPNEKFAPNGNVNSGQLVHLSADILADAIASVAAGFQRGVLKSGSISDYHIGGANIGYELTGLNVSKMVFNNFSLKVKKNTSLASGFYRLGTTDAIFYVNGSNGRCVFTSWDNFIRWGGRSDTSNVTSIARFAAGMTDYGACQ